MLRESIATLSDRERTIIELRFGLGGHNEYTQKEVAQIMGISQSYISRLEKRTIGRLRREMVKRMQWKFPGTAVPGNFWFSVWCKR